MKSTILLPLYVYPQPGAWDALYHALDTHPNLPITAIINPNSGPGTAPWWPNADYMRELPRLQAYANVEIVGYVRSGYCQRPIGEVWADVEEYGERGREGAGIGVGGIFLDETVNLFSGRVKGYLDGVDGMVRGCVGIEGGRVIIHNPGTAVNASLADPGPDVTVVAETAYGEFVKNEYQDWLATSTYAREKTCYMLNSVPEGKVKEVTARLKEKAAYLFLTSATADFYQSFDEASWMQFVEAMDEE